MPSYFFFSFFHLSPSAATVLRIANKYRLSHFEIEDALNDDELPKVSVFKKRIHILVNEMTSKYKKGPKTTFFNRTWSLKVHKSPLSIFLLSNTVVITIARRNTGICEDIIKKVMPMGTKVRLADPRYRSAER
jgi:hypothetical protein